MPADEELPAPTDEFFEIETAQKHGGWALWEPLSAQEKGKLMAHEMVKNMREHYYFDKRSERLKAGQPEPDKPKVQAPWDIIKNRFFNGGAAAPKE